MKRSVGFKGDPNVLVASESELIIEECIYTIQGREDMHFETNLSREIYSTYTDQEK